MCTRLYNIKSCAALNITDVDRNIMNGYFALFDFIMNCMRTVIDILNLYEGRKRVEFKTKPIHYTLNVNTKVIFVIITTWKHLNWTNNKFRKHKNRRIYHYSYLERKDCVRISSWQCVGYRMLESISCYGTFSYLTLFRQCRFYQRCSLAHNCKYTVTIIWII